MRLDTSVQLITELIAELQSNNQATEQELRNNIESRAAALLKAVEEKRTVEQQRALLETKLHEAQNENESNRAELVSLRSELERVEREAWENKVRRADLTARLKDRDRLIQEVQGSAAWKIVKPLWKLQRHFSRRADDISERDKLGELVFALDGPVTWTSAHDVLTIKGWCSARGGPQIVGVRAKVGRKSYFARYGLKREDVARTATEYTPALYNGFSINIPVPHGTPSVRLEAIAQGKSWECFLEHPLIPTTQDGRDVSVRKREGEDVRPNRINLPTGAYEQPPPMLYPSIRANQVLSVLAPLIDQHTRRVKSETPFFTVITPIFNTLPRWLAETAASLLNQTFPDWEWCLVDDGSQNLEVRQMLESIASTHSRFRVKFVEGAGISSATNQALDLARGEFVCFLDHDDLLHPEALATMAEKLREGFDVVYSDEDKLDDKKGTLVEPFFKPEWSPEYFRGTMYVGHLLCVRRELASRVRFNREFDGVQDFDFMLRVSETGAHIGHIARVLYHWRKVPGSIADASDAKPHVAMLQRKAVNAQLERLRLPAGAEPGATPHRLKIVPAPRKSFPKISIIIPTKDSPDLLSRCLNSLYENTAYPSFEVILIDNDTTNTEALEAMRAHPVIRLYMSNPFNFSRANNLAAQHATGEYLVFLNNDTEITAARWLDHLLYYTEQPNVGAAGALLLQENGAVQHGGVVLGIRGTADHVMRGFTAKSDGYAGSLSCAREVSAVTAACMMMRKSTFQDLQGFNEHFFTIYQDLDLCLRLRERGLRIIWTPQAMLLHHESVSRQKYYDLVDRYLLLDQWQETIERGDPYYNPNLNLESGDYSLRTKVC
jgi:GT2 family glycosyltransferase